MDGGGGKAGRDRPSSRSHPYDKRRESSGRSGPPPDERTENKLYVGNLDHRMTEYHVIKMFTPYGKIRREEFLWHTYGPKRGEPRGYAFVEYSKREEAELARSKMNGRMAFGRPLVVRFVDEKVVTYNTDAPVWNRDTGTTTATGPAAGAAASGAAGATAGAGVGRGGGAVTAAATATAADSARRARVAAIQSKLRTMEQEDRQRSQGLAPKSMDMIRPPPSGFGGGFHPGAGRGDGGGEGDRGGGQGRGAGGTYSRTLLQSGTRWSSWG
ncbi:hypothetical protein CLOM_g12067 [Closterium sp. NIES-68]|nr:hypothetical protein CLOM_g12067 [Closterium sp. NIES-68]GJP57963.1 hypothetical protein CLOP_g19879 [Closterium sp. NIES-67]